MEKNLKKIIKTRKRVKLQEECYRTEFGSTHSTCSKANLLTPGYDEGRSSVFLQDAKQVSETQPQIHLVFELRVSKIE